MLLLVFSLQFGKEIVYSQKRSPFKKNSCYGTQVCYHHIIILFVLC